ncbi:hypothetical protein ACHHYP_07566 [Achlya hypogyna]|uniref:Uncharacterized protein n=1 Tax=Achlya hypogyna TaxID=1202772 RepID=A0A1V9YQR8_ACHHY|nr:hypothetical protein ACHHYP_07566 [Achlya hypogyna]
MRTPSFAKQVAIRNAGSTPLQVEAVFGSESQAAEGQDFIRDYATVAPGATVVLGEHEFNMGSWTAQAPVFAVHAMHPTSNARASWSPNVSGIVTVVSVELNVDGHTVSFRQK